MRRFTERHLRTKPDRQAGYIEAVLAVARRAPDGSLELTDAEAAQIRQRYALDIKPDHPAPCHHLGPDTRRTTSCPSCAGAVRLKLFACFVHGDCTLARRVPGHACCATCPEYASLPPS